MLGFVIPLFCFSQRTSSAFRETFREEISRMYALVKFIRVSGSDSFGFHQSGHTRVPLKHPHPKFVSNPYALASCSCAKLGRKTWSQEIGVIKFEEFLSSRVSFEWKRDRKRDLDSSPLNHIVRPTVGTKFQMDIFQLEIIHYRDTFTIEIVLSYVQGIPESSMENRRDDIPPPRSSD